MNASGGRIATLGAWVRLCFVLVCGITATVQPSNYSSTEKEALRVLSKHKALFTLIPQRVAQILKMVRLHAHALPAQRLEIVHGALDHVEGKNNIVVQLRDAITQVRFKLAPHLRDTIKQQFDSLEKRFTDYISTLASTRKVLSEEQDKLLAASNLSGNTYKKGKAYQTAQAVLAPNHIDTLVDTLAGHDRAVSTSENAAINKLSREVEQLRAQVAQQADSGSSVVVVNAPVDEELADEVSALRNEVAALNSTREQPVVVESVAPIAKDFAQAMADMSVMHSLATIESAQTEQLKKAEKEAKKKEKKKKKKLKEKAEKEKRQEEKRKKEVERKEEKRKEEKKNKEEKASVTSAIRAELSNDMQSVGRGLLRIYRGSKNAANAIARSIAQIPSITYTGFVSLRDRVNKRAQQMRPALMSGVMTGSMAAPASWSLAGKLRTASLLDPTRVVEQPLLPETIQKIYDDAVTTSGDAVSRVWRFTANGARAGLRTLEDAAQSSGSLVKRGVQAAGSLTGSLAHGVAGISARGAGMAADGARALGSVAAHAGSKAQQAGRAVINNVRTAACTFGAKTCAVGAVTYDYAKAGAHKAATAATTAGSMMQSAFVNTKNSVSVPDLTARAGDVGDVVMTQVRGILDFVATGSARVMRLIANAVEATGNVIGSLVSAGWDLIGSLADTIRGGINSMYANSSSVASHGVSGVHTMGAKGMELAQNGLRCVTDAAGRCAQFVSDHAVQAVHAIGAGAQKVKDTTFAATKAVIDTTGGSANMIGQGAQRALAATRSVARAGTQGLGSMASSAVGVVNDGLNLVADNAYAGVTRGADMIRTGARYAVDTVQNSAGRLGSAAVVAKDSLSHGVTAAAGTLGAGMAGAATQAKQFTFTLGDAINHYLQAFVQLAKSTFSGAVNVVKNIGQTLMSGTRVAQKNIVGTARAVSAQLADATSSGAQRLRSVGGTATQAAHSAYRLAQGTLHQASDIASRGGQAVYDSGASLTRGIADLAQRAVGTMKHVAQNAYDIGGQAGTQVRALVRGSAEKLYSGVSQATYAVTNISVPYQHVAEKVKDTSTDCWNNVHGCITSGARTVGNASVSLKKGFHSFLGNAHVMLHDLFARATDFVSAVVQNVSEGIAQLGVLVRSLVDKAITLVRGGVSSAKNAAGAVTKNVVG